MHHHSRATDPGEFSGVDHRRKTDEPIEVANKFLGMPITRLLGGAIGFVLVTVFTVWLAHDRALAAQERQQKAVEDRVQKLEQAEKDQREREEKQREREEKQRERDTALLTAITEIKTTLGDVKERVVRIENHQQQGGK
ncbi:MAG TPA: hypothetical protein VF761_17005 [Gemmatimonadaceae bacterium]